MHIAAGASDCWEDEHGNAFVYKDLKSSHHGLIMYRIEMWKLGPSSIRKHLNGGKPCIKFIGIGYVNHGLALLGTLAL